MALIGARGAGCNGGRGKPSGLLMRTIVCTFLLSASAWGGSLPTLVEEPVTHPDRLRPGTAGTIALFDDRGSAGCLLLRSDPGKPPEEVHQFQVPCPDIELHWSRNGERALILFDGSGTPVRAWEVDLKEGRLWRLVPPTGDESLGGYVSPKGEITFTTLTPERPVGAARRVLSSVGFAPVECEQALFRGYRSKTHGTFVHVADVANSCGGKSVIGKWDLGTDYEWFRPGVVDRHARGEYRLLRDAGGFPQRVGPAGAELEFTAWRAEFWPAPVLPEWPVPKDSGSEW